MPPLSSTQDTVNANLKLSFFAERKCNFSPVSAGVYTALIHNFTCRLEACQALIYQLVLGLTGKNGKHNYSRAAHVYPPFFDITCSAKNYKIAPALTVLQQLKTLKGISTYYWTADRGTAEVDFVIDTGSDAIPIEVKAETNLQAKSLKVYREKYQPKLSIRTPMADYWREEWLLNLPLWAIDMMG